MDGALIVDKPAGMTSHDVVLSVRRLLAEKRIGHLGTLDPFATGVMALLVGKATRLAQFYRQREKCYHGIIRFGFATDTMDSTGAPLCEDSHPEVKEEELRRVMTEFTGSYLQHPPAFSAKKISGVPAYRLARKGVDVKLAAVSVVVHSLELLWAEGARAGFEARVSSGTYIRSLVNDIGERMKLGAHLAELRRTSLGEFGEPQALTLDELKARRAGGTLVLIAMEDLVPEFPMFVLNHTEVERVGQGNNLELSSAAERVRLMNGQGCLIAVAERIGEGLYHPVVVMVTAAGLTSASPETRPVVLSPARDY